MKDNNNNWWSNYTTGTIFQVKSDNNNNTGYPGKGDILDEDEETDFGEFKIPKKRASPPRIPYFNDEFANVELLNLSLERDISWVLLSAVGNNILENKLPSVRIEELKAVDSWAAFPKKTSHAETVKCKLEYLPVVSLSSHDNTVKWYMDNIVQIMEEIGNEKIFVYADEAIYRKIVMIMWLYNGKYENVIPLIGGFHTLLVYLKILYKKYNCLGLQDWWFDAGVIQEGSVFKAIEGKHQGGISFHKQSMNALLRIKIERNMSIEQV